MQEESVSSGKSVIALAFAVLLCAARAASAQDYPSRPLQMIVTLGAGGIVDILARGLAQEMDPRLGQRVIVVNRPGGGETIGMTALAQAPADGYTIAFTPVTPVTIQPHLKKDLQYSRGGFIPLCQTFDNKFFVAVGPKSPFRNFQELLAYAKANPGKLRYSTSGITSSPHLAGAELWTKEGVQLIDVPYPGEQGAFPHLLSGELDAGIITTTGVVSQKLRPLAIFSEERSKFLPDVPTVAELGYKVLPSGYGGLFVRAETPAPVVAKLESACREAAGDAVYSALAEKQFQQSWYLDRAAFTAKIEDDYRAKAALIPTLKIEQ
jgi:tripartite-type tricarboxylate transporter receptor subunit TctC